MAPYDNPYGPLVIAVGRYIGGHLDAMEERKAERKAKEAARAAEAAMLRRQQEMMKIVQEESKKRGVARDATSDEARAALRGRGGRPNPLDDVIVQSR